MCELTEALDKITVEMVNTINHGECIQLNDDYHLYKYVEEDIVSVFEESEDVEVIQVMINPDKESGLEFESLI